METDYSIYFLFAAETIKKGLPETVNPSPYKW